MTPCYINPAYRELIFGPRANDVQLTGGLLEALPGTGFQGLTEARKLATWVEITGDEAHKSFLLELEPSWLGGTFPTIQLELTKSSVEHFWVITSLPRTTLPKYKHVAPGSTSSTSSIRRPASQNFTLSELPHPRGWDQLRKGRMSPETPGAGIRRPHPPPGPAPGTFTASTDVST